MNASMTFLYDCNNKILMYEKQVHTYVFGIYSHNYDKSTNIRTTISDKDFNPVISEAAMISVRSFLVSHQRLLKSHS